jgi:putative ABC transport system permease protein
LLGGLIGLALGAATAALLARYAGWQTVVTSTSAITAFGFSAAVGMVFGIWPAKRAAALDPIEALRHE